jgi:GxxExxY protein
LLRFSLQSGAYEHESCACSRDPGEKCGLGPGLLEAVYQQCMVRELQLQAINVDTELMLKGEYKGLKFDIDYRMDMLVADKIVFELKVVEALLPVHKAQLLSYMRLSEIKLGLLINFNEAVVRDGIKRIVNSL